MNEKTSDTGEVTASLQRSAESLKRALPLLSRHGADFTPESYALWFAYAEGRHAELQEALDPLVHGGARLTAQQTRRLYDAVLAGPREQAVEQMRQGLRQLVAQTVASTASACASTDDFMAVVAREGAALADAGHELPPVQRLLEHSTVFAHALTELTTQLRESQARIEQLQHEIEAARREADIDGLTGLANRCAFDREIEELFQSQPQRGQLRFSLVLIDIDHFKSINDAYGHVFGDRVLRGIGDLLRGLVRGDDLATRFGGEEFAILLPRKGPQEAAIVAEHVRAAVEHARIRDTARQVELQRLSVSCGVAACRDGEVFATQVVERADAALYQAKAGGRNRVELAQD